MQYNRLTSETALLDLLKSIQRDIKRQQTQGSGTIIVTDENTGVETILGELPDGTVGFQPFVGDTEPPPVATAPSVSAEPGVFVITWDGLFAGAAPKPNDFSKCRIHGHKIVAGATVSTVFVGQTTTSLDITHVTTDVAAIGETWQFSLESVDYNGNEAELSLRSAELVMLDFPVNQAVNDALDDLNTEVEAANLAASNAQTAAANASQEAADASAAAASASGLAASKSKVMIQATAPTGADANATTLWIDTTGGANTPKKWVSGTTWTAVTDKVAIDAASAAATAQTKADQAFNNAATAATAAGTAQTTADSKNRVWYQTTAPAGTAHKNGDIWYDTDDGNKTYLWNSTAVAWQDFRDTGIAAAQSTANTALTSANGKNKIYIQNTMPTGGTYIVGDTWFDADDGNKIYTYNGTTFAAAQLGTNAIANLAITDAQIGNLDAAKLTTGFLNALRIAADSITADKLFVGDLTNLASDGSFLDLNKVNWAAPATSTVLTSSSEPNKLKIITAAAGNNDVVNLNEFSVTSGETIYAEVWVYGEAANVGGGTANLILTVTDMAGVKTYPVLANRSRVLASGNWSKISGVYAIPAGAKTANIRLNITFSADAVGNIWYFRDVIARRQVGGTYISAGGIITSHMTSGTIDAGILTAGSITAPKIAAKSITTDKLVISSTNNLVVEANFSNLGTSWELGANKTITTTSGRGSLPSFRVTGTIAAQTSVNLANKFTVAYDDRFRGAIFVKSNTALPAGSIKLQLKCYTTATAFTTIDVFSSGQLTQDIWMQVSSISPALPAGTIACEVMISVTNEDIGTITDIDYVSLTRAADGNLIVDGSITATKVNASNLWADASWLGTAGASSLKLTSTAAPINGVDPDGNPINTTTSSEVNSQGLRVINTITDIADAVVDVQDVIKLGTFDEDFFAINKAGVPQVTINSEGNVTAKSLDVDMLTVDGDDFVTYNDSRPRGMAAWGQVTINSNMSVSGGEIGLFEIGFESEDIPARMYQFNVNPFLIDVTAAGVYGIRLRYTTDGSIPTITNSSILGYNYFRASAAGLSGTGDFTRIIGSNNGNYLRVLVCMYASGGIASVYSGTGQTHLYCTVMDLGETREPTANATTAGGTPNTGGTVAAPAVPKVTRTTEWGYTGVRSYLGSNATYAYNTGKGYQGLSPAGYGNLKSIYVFPNTITSTIAGSTINGIWLYGYFEHWYNGAGGTARFRLHANTSLPGTNNLSSNGMNSGGWPRAAGRWVAVPSSLWGGFLSGAWKGFGFDGDSTYNTYGIANNARIRIKYTK